MMRFHFFSAIRSAFSLLILGFPCQAAALETDLSSIPRQLGVVDLGIYIWDIIEARDGSCNMILYTHLATSTTLSIY